MAEFNLTVEESKFQENKFLDSLKKHLALNNVLTQNAVIQTGIKRTWTIGEGIEKEEVYDSFDNPFDFKFQFTKFNVLANYVGRIKVENIKTSQKNIDNENLIIYSYLLKIYITFRAKKLLPIIFFVIGLFVAIGGENFWGTIFTVLFIILLWFVFLKIFGLFFHKREKEIFTNIISTYKDTL